MNTKKILNIFMFNKGYKNISSIQYSLRYDNFLNRLIKKSFSDNFIEKTNDNKRFNIIITDNCVNVNKLFIKF